MHLYHHRFANVLCFGVASPAKESLVPKGAVGLRRRSVNEGRKKQFGCKDNQG